jgi:hypothetical protein
MSIQAASDLLGVMLLVGTGIAFLGVVIVFLNNIIHRYWKKLNWFTFLNFTEEKKYSTQESVLENKQTRRL